MRGHQAVQCLNEAHRVLQDSPVNRESQDSMDYQARLERRGFQQSPERRVIEGIKVIEAIQGEMVNLAQEVLLVPGVTSQKDLTLDKLEKEDFQDHRE